MSQSSGEVSTGLVPAVFVQTGFLGRVILIRRILEIAIGIILVTLFLRWIGWAP